MIKWLKKIDLDSRLLWSASMILKHYKNITLVLLKLKCYIKSNRFGSNQSPLVTRKEVRKVLRDCWRRGEKEGHFLEPPQVYVRPKRQIQDLRGQLVCHRHHGVFWPGMIIRIIIIKAKLRPKMTCHKCSLFQNKGGGILKNITFDRVVTECLRGRITDKNSHNL